MLLATAYVISYFSCPDRTAPKLNSLDRPFLLEVAPPGLLLEIKGAELSLIFIVFDFHCHKSH